MSKQFLIAAGLLGLMNIQAQDPAARNGSVYQLLGRSGGGTALDEGFANRVVRGKPLSATEERHFVQSLGDGTKIETNQLSRLFRDSQGRTRVEEMSGRAIIFDPVEGFRAEIDPSTRTYRKVNNVFGVTGAYQIAVRPPVGAKGVTSETTETLRPQMVNGVMAQGVRTVMTIPRGEIGNDREIKVLTERWASTDLQMLIKSTNSDPRFGETTYQLTGIVEQEPAPSLFLIPVGYTEVTPGLGRGGAAGGRGGGPPAPANPPPPGSKSGGRRSQE
jgi:hypothetical protein